ncbi:MAG: hypothetical protein ACJ8C4_21665 [Gemmataceae bacterium]
MNRRVILILSLSLALGCGSSKTPPPAPSTTQTNGATPVVTAAPGTPAGTEKPGGSYAVAGEKKEDTKFFRAKSSGTDDAKLIKIEIEWPVTKEQYEDLKPGQSTFRVKNILGLSKLDLTPNGPSTHFQLTCKHGSVQVTLDFAGSDPELTEKSAAGL